MAADDSGIALAAEYVLLLGVSLLIFSAVFIGFNSFSNTANADARSESAYRVAVYVSECVSDASESGATVMKSVDMPERICGSPYVVYPSNDSRSICVLVNNVEYEAPVVTSPNVKVQGFMVSVPAEHYIDFERSSDTLTLS